MNNRIIILAVVLILSSGGVAWYFITNQGAQQLPQNGLPTNSTDPPSSGQSPLRRGDSPPSGLALPFAIEQVRAGDGGLNPFGVVRFSQDLPELGHAGIDIPLGPNAAIFAVADGEIIRANPANDGRPGQNVELRISKPQNGDAWVFEYEHILLDSTLSVGSQVQRGERIGKTALETSHNNHLQLELAIAIKKSEHDHNIVCWVDHLALDAAAAIQDWFAQVSQQPALQDSWRTSNREGYHEFRGLLDTSKFPDGPQLCYPPGTDVRTPVAP